MAKKIALLLTLVMMFTISCVFATESDPVATAETPVAAEDVVETSDEEVLEVSGDDAAEEPATSGETVETSGEEHDHDHETEGNGSAVVGAVIAVVIVVAIVAIVWILNKK